MSHPVWVRGLKHQLKKTRCHNVGVAPRVGAWIETTLQPPLYPCCRVAPRVGAWIETSPATLELKFGGVAPRVGAWIETGSQLGDIAGQGSSHPVWVRGLKQG